MFLKYKFKNCTLTMKKYFLLLPLLCSFLIGENKKVVFIEVQTGTYFGEDDIVRIEDDYNRS